jgi:hypothetical protein
VAKYLDEQVMPGDIVVAYQTDDKAIVGFCRVERVEGPLGDKRLFLKPIHHLKTPLKIHAAKKGTILQASLAINGRVMMRPLSMSEMREVIRLTGAPPGILESKAK